MDDTGDLTTRGLVFGDELAGWHFADGSTAVRRLIRTFHGQFGPVVADVIDELETARLERQQAELPALAGESTWTEEDKLAAQGAAAKAFADWRASNERAPAEKGHLEKELTERPNPTWPSRTEMDRRRNEARARLDALIAAEKSEPPRPTPGVSSNGPAHGEVSGHTS